MKRKKKEAAAAVDEAIVAEDLTPAVAQAEGEWDGPTRTGASQEIADLAAQSLSVDAAPEAPESEGPADGAAELEAAAEAEPSSVDEPVISEETASSELSAEASSEVSADASSDELSAEASSEGAAEAQLSGEPSAEVVAEDEEPAPVVDSGRLESIVESLLYAADRPLTVSDLKRLLNERDGKKLTAALETLRERHETTGIQLASVAGAWQFRTHPENGDWVAKLVAGRPQRLSRAMLETLAIIAYRQPITRPEIDEIRGVDCGPVLKTLLDRSFVRILGKKEEVGRPMLYGTTPDFLKTFSLKDLSELPTLREFHELSEQQMAHVDAKAPLATSAAPAEPVRSPFAPTPTDLTPVDQQEEDDLLAALDEATVAATRASGPPPAPEMSANPPAPAPEEMKDA